MVALKNARFDFSVELVVMARLYTPLSKKQAVGRGLWTRREDKELEG
jgi:hypothetical protein